MTFIGKLLVCINLALSLVLVTVALGLYTNRIDWSGGGPGSGSKGKVDELKQKLKPSSGWGLYDELAAAEAHYKKTADTLPRLQQVRVRNQAWYEKQLPLPQTSKDAVNDLVYENGQVALDKDGLPRLQPAQDRSGKPLIGADVLKGQITAKQGEIRQDEIELAKAIAEDEKLATEIGKPKKGLRALVDAEEFKGKQVEEEIEYLKPLWYNTLVEKELLVKRRELLELRKVQLEKAKGLVNK